MTATGRFVRYCRWAMVFALAIIGLLGSSKAFAQATGSTVNECSSGVVDSTGMVEMTVCLYGDQSGLTMSAEVDTGGGGGSDSEFVSEVGLQPYLYQSGTLVWNPGDQCCGGSETITNTIVPQPYVTYELQGNYDEDICNQYFQCNWSYGRYGLSVSVTVTPPPAAPTGLTATPEDGQVALSWTAPSGATSYNVYEGTSSGGEGSTPIVTGLTGTSYTAGGLTDGSTYYFTVAAVNDGGTSPYSSEVSATPEPPPPPAPTGLAASPEDGKVQLSWSPVTGATSYNVYESTVSGGEGSTPIITGLTGTSYTVSSLTNGTTYYFQVAAVNGGGASAHSNEKSATPEPPPPSAPSLGTLTPGVGKISLSWTAPSGATSYNVYEGTSTEGEGTTPIKSGITDLNYTVTGLTSGTTYYFTVAAVNAGGTSPQSNEESAKPEPPPPSAPTGLTAAFGNGKIALTWMAVSGATSYNVYEGTTKEGESPTPVQSGITTPFYTVTGLTIGTTYYFTVTAVNDNGTSGYSNEATATPAQDAYTYSNISYDSVGNVKAYTDSVNGTWSMTTSGGAIGYDTLNRLVAAQATAGYYHGLQATWSYDSFGNRTGETFSGTSQLSLPTDSTVAYDVNNQVSSTSLMDGGALGYDAAGDVTQDNKNVYAYDADGRVCATASTPLNGGSGVTQYIYDAEGHRVAKGTAHTVLSDGVYVLSCDTTQNGFTPTVSYILDPGGQQMTEVTSSDGGTNWTWAHTNVWAAGQLIATYSPGQSQAVLNFELSDWLGTRRVLTDYAGDVEQICHSLPYGSGEDCQPTPTEHLFTQHERDTETGNDYFGARYYASTMGRFLSPDWSAKAEPVPYAKLDNPQSLNLYAYVFNNPFAHVDPDGHYCKPSDNACTGPYAQGNAKGEAQQNTGPTLLQKIHNVLDPASDWANTYLAIPMAALSLGEDAPEDDIALDQLSEGGETVEAEATTAEDAVSDKFASLKAKAEELYSKKVGKSELHHIVPKYLGGDPEGERVSLPAAYHQLITNEFRRLAPYGQKIPRTAEQVGRILQQVYSKYPLR